MPHSMRPMHKSAIPAGISQRLLRVSFIPITATGSKIMAAAKDAIVSKKAKKLRAVTSMDLPVFHRATVEAFPRQIGRASLNKRLSNQPNSRIQHPAASSASTTCPSTWPH